MTDKKPAEPTAEQLLKLLDIQLEQSRKRREALAGSRANYRVIAILVILLGAAAAFGVLMHLAEEMRSASHPAGVSSEGR